VDGSQTNPLNTTNPNSPVFHVNPNAVYVPPFDPDHSVPGTTVEVFGGTTPLDPAPMNGFVQQANSNGQTPPDEVMNCFNPTTVPTITALASEFAIFDKWYASVPGPTIVNRLYLHSATSDGESGSAWDDVHIALGYPQTPIYQSIAEAGLTWGVYQEEIAYPLAFKWMREPANLHNEHWFEDFGDHVKLGKLSNYTFLAPRFFAIPDFPANDEHPSHDVSLGEKLISDIYATLRNSVYWNTTLFIVTYDEHGGYYDHVPTPQQGVPNPDGKDAKAPDPPFSFDRLGIRVPTVMASPWINKGTVVHEATGPTNTSQYEHSSVAATLKKIFGLQNFLTKRDAWAGTFEGIFTQRTTPRTDCPTSLPEPPLDRWRRPNQHKQSLNDLQKSLVYLAASLDGESESLDISSITTEQDGAAYVQKKMEKVLGRRRGERRFSPLLSQ